MDTMMKTTVTATMPDYTARQVDCPCLRFGQRRPFPAVQMWKKLLLIVLLLFASSPRDGVHAQAQSSQSQQPQDSQPQPLQGPKQQRLPFNCIQDLRQIYHMEADFDDNAALSGVSASGTNETAANDVIRTYVLCPGMTYEIAQLDFDHNMIPTSIPNSQHPPLPLRPNVHYKCGDNGSRSNLCVIKGGDIQVDGTSLSIDEKSSSSISLVDQPKLGSNVRLEGLTFVDAAGVSVWSTKPGSIRFIDCEWTDHTRAKTLIKLDHYDNTFTNEAVLDDGLSSDSPSGLIVRLERCLFHKNRVASEVYGSETSLITANGDQNTLFILHTAFQQNDMTSNNNPTAAATTTIVGTLSDGVTVEMNQQEETHLIESLGEVFMDHVCLSDNQVRSSDVAMYGANLVSQNIFSDGSEGSICAFASSYETLQQYETRSPVCLGATQATCELDTHILSTHYHHSIVPVGNGNNSTSHNNNHGNASYRIPRYVPFIVNALQFDHFVEIGTNVSQGNCKADDRPLAGGPDASVTDDAACSATGPCEISSTEAGEILDYSFGHYRDMENNSTGQVEVDISVRVSSNVSPKKFRLEILTQSGNVQYSQQFETTGLGWDAFTDVEWTNVQLLASNQVHTLRFHVVNGGINFCSVTVSYSGIPLVLSIESSDLNNTGSGSDPDLDITNATPTVDFNDSTNTTTSSSSFPESALNSTAVVDTTSIPCTTSSDFVCAVKDNVPEEKILYALAWACDVNSNPWVLIDCEQIFGGAGIVGSRENIEEMANTVFDLYWNGLNRADDACCFDDIDSGTNCIAEIRCSDTNLPVTPTTGNPDDSRPPAELEIHTLNVPGMFSALSFSRIGSILSSSSTNPNDIIVSRGNDNSDAECLAQRNDWSLLSMWSTSSMGAVLVNNDILCESATSNFDEYCAISNAQPNDYVEYDFVKDPTKSSILVTARMSPLSSSSSFDDNIVKFEIVNSITSSSVMTTPTTTPTSNVEETVVGQVEVSVTKSNGWDGYTSYIVWDSLDIGPHVTYTLRVTFLTGGVQLCSVGIMYALGVS